MPAALLFAAALLAPAQAPPATHPLVAVHAGELPIILSAPHGGNDPIPGVPKRKGEGLEKGGKGFFAGRDTGTEELLYAVALTIEWKTGKKPYSVAAKFSRAYLDANRPPEIAYEDPGAKAVYDIYRGTLAGYCREVQKQYGRGVVLDLHGQGLAKDTIFRGTQNGATVALLRRRFGEAAHAGPNGLFGQLAARGCKVFPPVGSPGPEQAGYTGGHITQTYGGEAFGLDAMQLEFGWDYRMAENRRAVAAKVADAVLDYHRRYLTDEGQ